MNTANQPKTTVYQHNEIEYYTRACKNGDRACSRVCRDWAFVVDGEAFRGYATKKQAIAAMQKHIGSR